MPDFPYRPGSILGRITPKTLKEKNATFPLDIRNQGEVQRECLISTV